MGGTGSSNGSATVAVAADVGGGGRGPRGEAGGQGATDADLRAVSAHQVSAGGDERSGSGTGSGLQWAQGGALAAPLQRHGVHDLQQESWPHRPAPHHRRPAGTGAHPGSPQPAAGPGAAVHPVVGEQAARLLPRGRVDPAHLGRMGAPPAAPRRGLLSAHEDLEAVAGPRLRGEKTASSTSTNAVLQTAPSSASTSVAHSS